MMPKAHRVRPASYPVGALPEPEPPAKGAPKPEWVEYAAALDVDTAGLSKAEIQKAVG